MSDADGSTLFAEASHAKTSASPARAKGSKASDPASGSRCSGSSTRQGRGTSSPRTSRPFALEDWIACSGRSLRSGTTRNGTVFPLPPLALLTAGIASGSLPFPTPTAIERPNEGNVRILRAKVMAGELTEQEAEQMLGKSVWESQGKVPAMWPTPVSSDHLHNATETPEAWKARSEAKAEQGINLHFPLRIAAQMFPTPTVQDATNNGGQSQFSRNSLPLNAVAGGALNPTWVEWLMGFPEGWTDSSSSVTPSCRTFRT